MMTHPISEAELIRYLEEDIESARRDQIAAHLSECPACRDRWQDVKKTGAAIHATDEDFVTQDLVLPVQRAIAAAAPQPRFAWWTTYASFAAAGLAVLITVGSVIQERALGPGDDEYRAKGAGVTSPDAWVDLHVFGVAEGG